MRTDEKCIGSSKESTLLIFFVWMDNMFLTKLAVVLDYYCYSYYCYYSSFSYYFYSHNSNWSYSYSYSSAAATHPTATRVAAHPKFQAVTCRTLRCHSQWKMKKKCKKRTRLVSYETVWPWILSTKLYSTWRVFCLSCLLYGPPDPCPSSLLLPGHDVSESTHSILKVRAIHGLVTLRFIELFTWMQVTNRLSQSLGIVLGIIKCCWLKFILFSKSHLSTEIWFNQPISSTCSTNPSRLPPRWGGAAKTFISRCPFPNLIWPSLCHLP